MEQMRTKVRKAIDDRVTRAWIVAAAGLVAVLLIATQVHH